ncbi:MAG: hypothetical protein COA36_08030 [Desulfotalea sp.]|nr:MAG: hypothetical protein COA36_08030 [Desulfotalea sp.]
MEGKNTMIKPVTSILFATDLTANCQRAFDFTIDIATRLDATIYMLYVIEKLSEHVDVRVKNIVGVHQWEEMLDSHKLTAHKSLLGKTPTNSVVRKAIHDFCKQEDMQKGSADFTSREIIISHGDIVAEILSHSQKNECGLIVLGGHKNMFSKTAVGSTAKRILKKSTIPVTMVPPESS